MGSTLPTVGWKSKSSIALTMEGVDGSDFSISVAPFVTSEEGMKTQRRIWNILSAKLEKIQPGIMANI